MKKFLLLIIGFSLVACTLPRQRYYWRVRDVALHQAPVLELHKPGDQNVLTISTRTVQEIMLAHLRINRTAGVQTELYIVEGDQPNAFAGILKSGQRVIAINLGMMRLIGSNIDEFAALIGHEAAHWAKGHVAAGQTRASTLNALGTVVGLGLSAAGVPAAGLISGFGVDLLDATFNRNQEREADAASIDYMLANRYDPAGAVTLHEKFVKIDRALRLPFLSSHPSNEERIQNLKVLIESKKAREPGASE